MITVQAQEHFQWDGSPLPDWVEECRTRGVLWFSTDEKQPPLDHTRTRARNVMQPGDHLIRFPFTIMSDADFVMTYQVVDDPQTTSASPRSGD